MSKELVITISPDGENVKIDKIGFSGSECTGKADDIIKALGTLSATELKNDYYREEEVHVEEFE